MTTYRLFPSTSGPSSPVSYSGPFMAGVLFEVTTGGCWFEGYWWWVCPSGQSTSPQKFALWQVSRSAPGLSSPAATVTSGTLTAGQWNYVPLATPVPLAIGAGYNAAPGSPAASPIDQHPVRRGESLQRRDHERAAVRVLRPVRVAARAVFHVPGRLQRGRHRSHGPMPANGIQLRQLLDGRPGRRTSPRTGRATGCGPITRFPPMAGSDSASTPASRPWAPSSCCRSRAR